MDTARLGGAPVTTVDYARFAASLVASLIASMIGGVVMAVVMVVAYAGIHKMGLLYALRPIGAFLYGDAMMSGPTPMMYGAAVAFHFGICALWGIAFAVAASLLRVERSFGGSLVLGIVIGLASQIIDVNLVAPPLLFGVWGHDIWTETVPSLYSWLGHVAFGLCFALTPAFFGALWPRFGGRHESMFDDPRIR
jgi:hypothetical protein